MIENNTSNVFAAFDILMEKIEAEIDLINKIGARVWERRDYGGAGKAAEHATQITAYRNKIASLRKEWQILVGAQEDETEEKITSSKPLYYEPERVTGTKPATVSILGQRFIVHTWREVFERVMNTIFDLRPEKFEQIMRQFPQFVGRNEKRFTKARKLKNGTFIEVNLSATDILHYCFQVLETIELSPEDLVVVTV